MLNDPCAVFAGDWYVTLFYNRSRVAEYNQQLRQRLVGPLYLMHMSAGLRLPSTRPAAEQRRLLRRAQEEIAARLHQDPLAVQGNAVAAHFMHTGSDRVAFGMKVGMPVLVAQRFDGIIVSVNWGGRAVVVVTITNTYF